MFYKHNLQNLGIKYSFPEELKDKNAASFCDSVAAPSTELLEALEGLNLQKQYHRANHLMEVKSKEVNGLFSSQIKLFLSEEKQAKPDTKYFMNFLNGHFAQERHLRVLIVELIGQMLLSAENSETGLSDDLKNRKLINKKQYELWQDTVDTLATATEVLNAASYSADDVFDRTPSRYGNPTVYQEFGAHAATISADILLHSFGNYLFYQTIRIHEQGAEAAYLTGNGSVSAHDNPYSLVWQDKKSETFVYINPEQYMDVWEVWSWAWYMINSGQIRDLHEFNLKNIATFNTSSYLERAYRLSGGFMECASHLASAFTGCGYWQGRQAIGKWAAIYGTMLQIRNDFYDHVVYTVEGSAHKFVKETHEDISLGRVTLPLGYAYAKASALEKKSMLKLANALIAQKDSGTDIKLEDKVALNRLIEKNGGFQAAKKLIYNLTLWALDELLALRQDFAGDEHYQMLLAWTIASLNIANLQPAGTTAHPKLIQNIFDLKSVYEFLKT